MKTKRIQRVIGTLLILLSVLLAYALFCYHMGFGIPCLFHVVTGLKCPGCGITGMFVSLMKFDIQNAFNCNPVLLCLSPVFIIISIRYIYVYIKNGNFILGKFFDILIYILIAVLFIFGILRNII